MKANPGESNARDPDNITESICALFFHLEIYYLTPFFRKDSEVLTLPFCRLVGHGGLPIHSSRAWNGSLCRVRDSEQPALMALSDSGT